MSTEGRIATARKLLTAVKLPLKKIVHHDYKNHRAETTLWTLAVVDLINQALWANLGVLHTKKAIRIPALSFMEGHEEDFGNLGNFLLWTCAGLAQDILGFIVIPYLVSEDK